MIWIFGYGSLMWRPDFPFQERHPALLNGYHRSFSRISTRHRGTPENPGMVVALEPGGVCQGIVYGIDPGQETEIMSYLDDREGAGYNRVEVTVEVAHNGSPASFSAQTYFPVVHHPTHAPDLPIAKKVALIATGCGISGTAYEYLVNLLKELETLGIQDEDLHATLTHVEAYRRDHSISKSQQV